MTSRSFSVPGCVVVLALIVSLIAVVGSGPAIAEPKGEKAFHAVVTDAQGVITELKNVVFYWEERISDTAFVPHEMHQVPVKRGTATVNVKFDTIKQIDVKQGNDGALPTFAITLTNGKTGQFAAALSGSFRGESDFGQTEIPITSVNTVVFK